MKRLPRSQPDGNSLAEGDAVGAALVAFKQVLLAGDLDVWAQCLLEQVELCSAQAGCRSLQNY